MKRIKKLLTVWYIVTFVSTSFACINTAISRTKLTGKVDYQEGVPEDTIHDGIIYPRYSDFENEQIPETMNEYFEKYQKTGSLEAYSEYGALLIFTGEFEKARKVYLEIESKEPGLYATASNLGTAYELLGKLDSASIWISEGIKRNPVSHDGSEWIHVNILAFKSGELMALNNSILGLDFGTDTIPVAPDGLSKDSLYKISEHIIYQLQERLFFVKSPSQEVAHLYHDYAMILALTNNLEEARGALKEAKKFGLKSDLLSKRLMIFDSMIKETQKLEKLEVSKRKEVKEKIVKVKDKPNYVMVYSILGGSVMLLGVAMIFILKKRRK